MQKQRRRPRMSKKARARLRRRHRNIILGGGALLCALAVLLFIYILRYRYVHRVDDNMICGNIYIGETDVSGMTADQAKKAIKKKMEEYGLLPLTMKAGEQSAEATFQELGLDMRDVDHLTDQAVAYGKKGSVWKRYSQMKALEKEKLVIDEKFQLNADKAAKVIEEKTGPLKTGAVDASIVRSDEGFTITDGAAGESVDTTASIQKIETYLNDKWNYKAASVEMVIEKEEPRITRADLESIQDELGSYSTDAGYGSRVTNLKRGAELLNGTVLLPGEELSVLEKTLPYTEENGYVDGGAYANGEVVQSIAGGICQVSSTLYNAVLYAELEVTQRSAHSMSVSYVKPSKDAAVAEGVKDFKFKNNYSAPIFIEGYIDDNGTLQFHIYGKETRDAARSVEYESEVLEQVEYTTRYVEDSDSAIGSMNEKGTPINGKTARLWKVVYENGNEVSREVINNSTYNASEVKVLVGTRSDNPQASKLVQDAIGSQNEEQIWGAIGEAQALINNPNSDESAESKAENNTENNGEGTGEEG